MSGVADQIRGCVESIFAEIWFESREGQCVLWVFDELVKQRWGNMLLNRQDNHSTTRMERDELLCNKSFYIQLEADDLVPVAVLV